MDYMDEPEDVVIEPEHLSVDGIDRDEEAESGLPEQKITKMRAELAECRKDKQEYMDGWQRAKADYVNLLKRFEAETKSAKLSGVIKAVETLLPALDALERSKEHGEIPEGFLAIARQLENAFAALGLESVGEVGEPFDPQLHEALGQDAVDSSEKDHTLTAVLERGWRIDNNVIRAAKVRVAHFASA